MCVLFHFSNLDFFLIICSETIFRHAVEPLDSASVELASKIERQHFSKQVSKSVLLNACLVSNTPIIIALNQVRALVRPIFPFFYAI